mgnify:CR=1 FL=1
MKIVVLDGYTENPGDLSWAPLEALGELTVYDRTNVKDETEIIRRIGDAEIVLTNKTPISRTTLTACPSICFIAVLATGYNVVDLHLVGFGAFGGENVLSLEVAVHHDDGGSVPVNVADNDRHGGQPRSSQACLRRWPAISS